MEQITLIGYLGVDAKVVVIDGEERFFQSSLAPARSKNKDNDKRLVWYQLNFSLGLRNLMPYLKKGGLVAVVGHPRITAYSDKNNQPTPSCTVYVDKIELLGKKGDESSQTESSSPSADNGSDPELPF